MSMWRKIQLWCIGIVLLNFLGTITGILFWIETKILGAFPSVEVIVFVNIGLFLTVPILIAGACQDAIETEERHEARLARMSMKELITYYQKDLLLNVDHEKELEE